MPNCKLLWIGLAALTPLSACSDPLPVVCPPVADYSESFKTQLAGELRQLGDGAAALRVIEDYGVLRQQVKTCSSSP